MTGLDAGRGADWPAPVGGAARKPGCSMKNWTSRRPIPYWMLGARG